MEPLKTNTFLVGDGCRIMKKVIGIVTGASSGMGREFVKQFDTCLRHIDEVWVIARRKDRLEMLQNELQYIKLRVLPYDICKQDDLDALQSLLERENPAVRVLVNAAGVGRAGRLDEITRQEAENMVMLNCQALTALTHMILPYMNKPGHIIQLASASAFMPQKEFAVYAATKSYVLSFSKALRREVKKEGIIVTTVCPGPVNTEFLEISNRGRKQKWLKKITTVNARDVVKKALLDAKQGKTLSIYGMPMKLVYIISKIMP